jgi:hypothetical protein
MVGRLDRLFPELTANLRLVAAVLAAIVAAACTSAQRAAIDSAKADSIARARQDSINRAQPGYVIDSVLPVEKELRRFREAMGGRAVTSLQHASGTREDLVRRVLEAFTTADTATLHTSALSAREFSDLVFPTSRFARAPYRQPPGLVWMQMTSLSESMLRRSLRRMAGTSWRYLGHDCSGSPEHEGRNTIWSACTVRALRSSGDTGRLALVGSIIARDGRYKVVGYR